MEKIIIKRPGIKPKEPIVQSQLSKKLTVIIDQPLLTKLRNIIAGEKASGHYRYYSVSALIRASLQSYQEQPTIDQVRQLGNPRVAFTVVLPLSFYQLYQSWPVGQRTAQFENIILTYLHKI